MSTTLNDFRNLLEIVRYYGDGPVSIPLTHPNTGAAYTPTGTLLCTVKASFDDDDDDARVQKISSIGGITVANPTVVTFVSLDFANLTRNITYEFDVREQIGSNPPLTLARGTIRWDYEITREMALSIPTYTTTPATLSNLALTSHGALRALVTADGSIAVNTIRTCVINLTAENFYRVAGTNADDDANFIRPTDYNGITNAYVWARIS